MKTSLKFIPIIIFIGIFTSCSSLKNKATSMKTIINTPNAPAPIGPYNQAILSGHTLYVSGTIALDPKSGIMIQSDIEAETHQVMKNLGEVLKAAGMDYASIVKTTIFVTDLANFAKINEIYGSYFTSNFPARETVQVSALPKNANVEISVIAVK